MRVNNGFSYWDVEGKKMFCSICFLYGRPAMTFFFLSFNGKVIILLEEITREPLLYAPIM